ncbi:hypothetical protein K5037_004865 [Escherichia coli]|nr:hypothetical protein [Escherichia coli]
MSNYQQRVQESTRVMFCGELFDRSVFCIFADKFAPVVLDLVAYKLREGCSDREAHEAAKTLVSATVQFIKVINCNRNEEAFYKAEGRAGYSPGLGGV